MSRLKINYIVDMLMMVLFIITAITGVILFYWYYYEGSRKLHQTTMSTWHNYIGLLFIVIMSIHIILHYKWIISTSKNIIKKK